MDKNICKLYSIDKMTSNDIAKQFSISPSSVLRILKKNNIPIRDVNSLNKKFNDEEELILVDKYNKGITIPKLAKEYKVGRTTIRRVLEKHNVVLRAAAPVKKLTDTDEIKAIELYKTGLSMSDVGLKFNVTAATIHSILHKNKAKIHPTKKYTVNEEYFDNIDTEEKAYIFGLLYADGNNFHKEYTNNYVITLQLQKQDKYILERIKKALKYTGPLTYTKLKHMNHSNTWTLRITSKKLSNKLSELGLVPRKSLIKKYPYWLDKSLEHHFIRGYFDGNGSITTRGKAKYPQCGIASNKHMVYAFKDIFKELGVISKIYKKEDNKSYSLMVYTREQCVIMRDYLYKDATIYLHRKKDKFFSFRDERYRDEIDIKK